MPLMDPEAERRMKALEDRLSRAEGDLRTTVKYNQTAAQGGSHIIAQMIRGASGGLSSVLVADFMNELITAYDAAGIARSEFGNMPLRGNSPAQWGMRANDASGTPIFDSLGLIGVVTRIANSSTTTAGTKVGTAGPPYGPLGATFGGANLITSVGFTLTRTQTIRIEGLLAGLTAPVGAGSPGTIYVQVTGQAFPTAFGVMNSTAGAISGTAYSYQILSLAAGTYTGNLYWASINGAADTLQWNTYSLDVYLWGG